MFGLKLFLSFFVGYLVAEVLEKCDIKFLSWQWFALGIPSMFILIQLIDKILLLE